MPKKVWEPNGVDVHQAGRKTGIFAFLIFDAVVFSREQDPKEALVKLFHEWSTMPWRRIRCDDFSPVEAADTEEALYMCFSCRVVGVVARAILQTADYPLQHSPDIVV